MIGWVSLVLEFICLLIRRKSINTLFPYTTLFRSLRQGAIGMIGREEVVKEEIRQIIGQLSFFQSYHDIRFVAILDRKSTRLNSSHVAISYAVFCLKKKRITIIPDRVRRSSILKQS